jgi:hypothetical protein
MGVLVMVEHEGDTAQLIAASDEITRRLPAPDGLLVRIVAPTDDGVVLLHLWETAEARKRHADNPAHIEALEASGIKRLARGSRSRVFDGAALHHVAEAQTG